MGCYGFHNLVVYLDGFLLVENSWECCLEGQNILIQLLRRLGFAIAWDKIVGPTQILFFLGVQVDSTDGTMTLPPEKLDQFRDLIIESLNRKCWSLKQLQQLAGKLNWALFIVCGSRVYLHRILDVMQPWGNNRHKLRVPASMQEDLLWWNKFLPIFNGVRVINHDDHFYTAAVDACTAGADWAYVNWAKDYPSLRDSHISVNEAAASLLAIKRWGPPFGKTVK